MDGLLPPGRREIGGCTAFWFIAGFVIKTVVKAQLKFDIASSASGGESDEVFCPILGNFLYIEPWTANDATIMLNGTVLILSQLARGEYIV